MILVYQVKKNVLFERFPGVCDLNRLSYIEPYQSPQCIFSNWLIQTDKTTEKGGGKLYFMNCKCLVRRRRVSLVNNYKSLKTEFKLTIEKVAFTLFNYYLSMKLLHSKHYTLEKYTKKTKRQIYVLQKKWYLYLGSALQIFINILFYN